MSIFAGWKTYTGVAALVLGWALDNFCPVGATIIFCKYANTAYGLGAALGLWGVRDKMERMAPGK